MPLEGVELLLPPCLELIKPLVQWGHRLGAKLEQADPGVVGRALIDDQAGPEEDS